MSPPAPTLTELGKILREARIAQHMTQEEAAALSGIGRRFISEVEQGKPTAQVGKVLALAAALGVGLVLLSKWKKS